MYSACVVHWIERLRAIKIGLLLLLGGMSIVDSFGLAAKNKGWVWTFDDVITIMTMK